ncbi:hypothetical protein [Macrococcoides bohemicum]|uniref:hypothetical protein n=1 Tax=Macrococcoides bohemicum TaxID=1903056 RepID=UPI00193F301A|nr:hypothetical protein [Macrococcus bohemicus]QRN50733.1 hypothetical protein HT586_11200 [Macrococcus bohemicus]
MKTYPSVNQHFSTNEVIRTMRASQGEGSFAIPVPCIIYPILRKNSFFNKLYDNLTYSDDMNGSRNELNYISVEEGVKQSMK